MTSNPTAAIGAALAALDRAWADASCATAGAGVPGAGVPGGDEPGAGVPGGGVQRAVEGMTDAGLLAVNEALATVRRRVDALHVRVAAGIAERSRPELGADSLARKTGHRTPAKLIAATTGGHAGDAARLIQVGEATQERSTFTGHRAPARHPHVQAALGSGAISVPAAAAITTMLDKIAIRVERDVLDDAERTLTERAATLTLDELGALIQRAAAHLDPDGLEPVIADLHARRSLKIREDRDGAIHLTGVFDPATGAPILTAIDALVTTQLRTTRGHNHPDHGSSDTGPADTPGDPTSIGSSAIDPAGPVVGEETRTLPQLRADALAALCRHTLGCDQSGATLAATTVIVRIPLDALTSGTGVATIDGITQPIDAGTARRMCADAQIIPVVLGARSEILDLGRTRRTFTKAQRRALEERDGGCASCGLPPAYTEAHHIWWWSRGGPTDLANAVLLCTTCHHRIHTHGWEIRVTQPRGSTDPTAGTVWFIPPPDIDATRTPRTGGRARFDWTRAA